MALLAGHLMLDAYRQGGDVGYVVAGAAILEACLRGSKYNFQAKVLLIQFYRLLGASRVRVRVRCGALCAVMRVRLRSRACVCGGGRCGDGGA